MSSRVFFRGSARAVQAALVAGTLVPQLERSFSMEYGHRPNQGEITSWLNSIPTIAEALISADLAEVEMLLEFRVPISGRRMDVVLVGSHPNGGPSVVVVENKQWSAAQPLDDGALLRVPGLGGSGHVHPILQTWGYCTTLTSYVRWLADAKVAGLVNMHNATSADLAAIRPPALLLDDTEAARHVRMYGADEASELRTFLRANVTGDRALEHADALLRSDIGPTPALMDVVTDVVLHRPMFQLLDEQRFAYEYVLHQVDESRRSDHKEVVVIVGEPGTGKSVIALELLGELSRRGIGATHATGSKSFTLTLRKRVGAENRRAKDVFTYFNNYAHLERNSIPVLIADEAHRIRESSNHRFTRRDKRSVLPQVVELINAARVPIFLLDENQVVRRGEIGSVAEISEAARELGLKVVRIDLQDQFRCAGSPEYVEWVEDLLELSGKPSQWGDSNFDLRLAESPEQMEKYLRGRQEEGLVARIAAGYCWEWSDPRDDGTLVDDVVIDAWRRPWNSRAERSLNGIPPSSLWATDPAGFDQVGCIYTAQGFEYDYAGTILGPDLVWRHDRWVSQPSESRDRYVKSAADFDRLVRNTYKVLLTRGMRGGAVYSVDQQTQQMLRRLGIPSL